MLQEQCQFLCCIGYFACEETVKQGKEYRNAFSFCIILDLKEKCGNMNKAEFIFYCSEQFESSEIN
jgi:hypothetical protein